jgi:hypothetical protein
MRQRRLYPLERRQGLLFVRAAVGDGIVAPVIARLLVDAGSSFTVLSMRILQSAGADFAKCRV